MAKERTKTKEISITQSKGGIFLFKKQGDAKKDYNFKDISDLRQILSNEKARMLYVIKNQNPSSIYELARKLDRNFKSVSDDIAVLKKFGLVEIKEEYHKKRKKHRPSLVVDTLSITIRL